MDVDRHVDTHRLVNICPHIEILHHTDIDCRVDIRHPRDIIYRHVDILCHAINHCHTKSLVVLILIVTSMFILTQILIAD
jgi:hypothetical protein